MVQSPSAPRFRGVGAYFVTKMDNNDSSKWRESLSAREGERTNLIAAKRQPRVDRPLLITRFRKADQMLFK